MKDNLNIWRDENGIPHVTASTLNDMYWGNGYVHARDRGMQMLLMRILGQGRASEILDASDDTLAVDLFFRRFNWSGNIEQTLAELTPEKLDHLQSYSDGVNAAFAKSIPWEFKLLGYKPEKWLPENCIMITRMIGYLTLAQSQTEMERLLIELVQADISLDKLNELFPNILGGLDIDLIKKVQLQERIVPSNLLWGQAIPRMMASNNWVIAGSKTKSGKPIIANDPHLEVNRLPNVWSELVLECNGRYSMGGTMPGFPGVLIGRSNTVSWAMTYSFLDAVDSWIEQCKDGKYYRQDNEQWPLFNVRKEIIKRKKKADHIEVFYENNHGVLDGDPNTEGFYLSTLWAANHSGTASVEAFFDMWAVDNIQQAMDTIGKVETGWNCLVADAEGDIGFQMTGLVPKRAEGISGLVPLPGWLKENDWQGFIDYKELPRLKNPENGHFETANNDLNKHGIASPINMPMGSYRADRISQLLEEKDDFTVADSYKMHFDVYSLQAEYFMNILRPILESPLFSTSDNAKILAGWDLNYDAESVGAYLFEEFYKQLYLEVFGENGLGKTVTAYLKEETGIFIDFYDIFDRILLSEQSLWFGDLSRQTLYQHAAEIALKTTPKQWHQVQQITLSHLLFGNKLPKFLGFDRGPITAIGNRATIHQGQIYRSAGRDTSFMPSYRTVMDFAEETYHTVLAGGPSDRRFSKWYCSDLENWASGTYKSISINPQQKKSSFK